MHSEIFWFLARILMLLLQSCSFLLAAISSNWGNEARSCLVFFSSCWMLSWPSLEMSSSSKTSAARSAMLLGIGFLCLFSTSELAEVLFSSSCLVFCLVLVLADLVDLVNLKSTTFIICTSSFSSLVSSCHILRTFFSCCTHFLVGFHPCWLGSYWADILANVRCTHSILADWGSCLAAILVTFRYTPARLCSLLADCGSYCAAILAVGRCTLAGLFPILADWGGTLWLSWLFSGIHLLRWAPFLHTVAVTCLPSWLCSGIHLLGGVPSWLTGSFAWLLSKL